MATSSGRCRCSTPGRPSERYWIPSETDQWVAEARRTTTARVFLNFSRLPATRSVTQPDGSHRVQLVDVRFVGGPFQFERRTADASALRGDGGHRAGRCSPAGRAGAVGMTMTIGLSAITATFGEGSRRPGRGCLRRARARHRGCQPSRSRLSTGARSCGSTAGRDASSRSCWTTFPTCSKSIIISGVSAVAADRVRVQVERRAAVRALDRLHPRAELGKLLRIERPDEILLAQEIHERHEAAIAGADSASSGRWCCVWRSSVARSVRRQRGQVCLSGSACALTTFGVDDLEQAERGGGGKPQVLHAVEPEPVTLAAEVDRHLLAVVRIERERPHGLAAGRAERRPFRQRLLVEDLGLETRTRRHRGATRPWAGPPCGTSARETPRATSATPPAPVEAANRDARRAR